MYDSKRYNQLVSDTAVNLEFFRGTIQDTSRNKVSMSINGTPTITRNGNALSLIQNVANDGVVSTNAINSLIDITGNTFFEAMFLVNRIPASSTDLLTHNIANGGFSFKVVGATNTYSPYLYFYDAASAIARSSTVTLSYTKPVVHIVANALSGIPTNIWINSIPMTTTLAGAGVAANGPSQVLRSGYTDPSISIFISRCWQGTVTNEDVTCLFQAAKENLGLW